MASTLKQWRLMPGAEVVEVGEGADKQMALVGIPPCLKLFFQRKLPAPTTFVLPEEFFRKGVVQVCLEFFVYYFLFVLGKAFGKLPADARIVVIGTEQQLARARRILALTLFGPDAEEMQGWKRPADGRLRRVMRSRDIERLARYRAWFAPKQQTFPALKAFVDDVRMHRCTGELRHAFAQLGVCDPHPLVAAFVRQHAMLACDDPTLAQRAYEFGSLALDDFIEWRAYDASGRTQLLPGVTIARNGDGTFTVSNGIEALAISTSFTEDQAPHLITMPPQPEAAEPDVFSILCLGSDSGFEMEHPTTGFAISINGQWAIVDAPVCASYLLQQHGIDAADVRVILETHGHEDHMGSAMHFLLERLAAGRSFTYVAAEPVYRTCVAKIAAVLDRPEEEIDTLLSQGGSNATVGAPRGGVIRVTPGEPLRLLGATWSFAWMVHPIPTTGFRIELTHDGATHALAYSADQAPRGGFSGTDAMAAAGFYDAQAEDPFPQLVRGGEDLVLWEAGGTNGDPIHYDARDWDAQCRAHGVDVPVCFMHVHPLPPELRNRALARPGWRQTLVRSPHVRTEDVVAAAEALRQFRLDDHGYWLELLLRQGAVRSFAPGAAVVAQGDAGDAWYLILRGSADVVASGERVGELGSHAFFGELALLPVTRGSTPLCNPHAPQRAKPDCSASNGSESGRRQATVRAANGPLVVLRVPADTFRDFVCANELAPMFEQYWARVGLLRSTRLFVGFPHAVVGALATTATRQRFRSGDALIRQGTMGDELFVIESGTVRILKDDGAGSIAILGTRGPGEVLGEYGVVVPGGVRTATIRAETDVTALVLTRAQLHEVVAGQLPLQVRIIALAKERGMPEPQLGVAAA
ncbi:MAG: cyclic nucleotide-binding domain-containing protein [bacterium]|nr:cyclic nucleotide-binding domain-containing protein [bacterium]